MPGKFFIRLTVNRELFFACLPQNANCFFGFIPNFKFAFKPETIISLQNIGCIPCKITFREAEIMDGIQQIRFSNPVASRNAYYSFCEWNKAAQIILELDQGDVIQSEHRFAR
jgi:hypothetical protein